MSIFKTRGFTGLLNDMALGMNGHRPGAVQAAGQAAEERRTSGVGAALGLPDDHAVTQAMVGNLPLTLDDMLTPQVPRWPTEGPGDRLDVDFGKIFGGR